MTLAGPSSPTRSSPVAVLLGAGVTVLVALTSALGLWDRLELLALDERLALVRHDPGQGRRDDDTDPITHVNIDDRSLQEIGRWPWPRKVIANIVTALSAAGAKTIALDVIFPDPQEVRLVDPAADIYTSERGQWLQQGPPQRVYDDLLLASAIADANHVLVPMHVDFDAATPLSNVQRAVAKRFQSAGTEPNLPTVLGELFDDPLTAPSDARAAARREYLRRRAIRALERFALDPAAVGPAAPARGEMTPPLVLFAQVADGTGFVTVEPDRDHAVRRIRLIGRAGGHLHAQFALAMAQQLRRIEGQSSRVSLIDGHLRIGRGSSASLLPVDSHQRMIIRWSDPSDRTVRISAAAVAAAGREHGKLRANLEAADVACWQLASMGRGFPNDAVKTLYWRCAELSEKLDAAHKKRLTRQERYLRRRLYRPGASLDPEGLAEATQAENHTQQQLREALRSLAGRLRDRDVRRAFLLGDANAPPNAESEAVLRRAEELLVLIDRLEASRGPLRESIRSLEAQFADFVRDRVVLIGSTATGAADFVPTPRGPRTPGVEVHADILRTILSGWSVRPAGLGWDLLAIVATGLVVTAVATGCGALRAAALSIAALVVLIVGNAWVLFAWAGVSLAVAAPTGAMVGSFLVVTAYRQLTEERARRRIRRMFSHAVSPDVAEELMRNPSLANVGGERREISCLFSDLGGFTDLSGRIGSQATVWLLNHYFDEVTDAVQHVQQGYLNKFLGDGVLALFGAPLEQRDHATRAVRAAVDCHRRVAELNAELAANPDTPPGELRLRAGVASGEAMVGNCGSSERMDYTAIGDCVNLASRLETACKFFRAKLLVSADAWKQAAVELPARPLGPLWITGVDQPIEVHEVLIDDVATAGHLSHFAEGIEHLRRERYGQAAEAFESLAARRPTDRAVSVFAEVARALANDEDPGERAGNGTVRIAWTGSEGFASA